MGNNHCLSASISRAGKHKTSMKKHSSLATGSCNYTQMNEAQPPQCYNTGFCSFVTFLFCSQPPSSVTWHAFIFSTDFVLGILWHCLTGAAGGVTITRRAYAVVFQLCLCNITHMPMVSLTSWHFSFLVTQEQRQRAQHLKAVSASITRLNACWKPPWMDDYIRFQARWPLLGGGLQWLLIVTVFYLEFLL